MTRAEAEQRNYHITNDGAAIPIADLADGHLMKIIPKLWCSNRRGAYIEEAERRGLLKKEGDGKSMNLAQMEHTRTLQESLPELSTFDRLEDLFRSRRVHSITIATKESQLQRYDMRNTDPEAQASDWRAEILNTMTQATLRRMETEKEIIEVAKMLVAESKNAELIAMMLTDEERAA